MLDGERVWLLEPQTFMNESGRSIAEAARFMKLPLADVVVFHDELDLAAGKVRVKLGGGVAGHNGLRSADACLGSREFKRVRIGIGHPGHKDRVTGHVLADFHKAEQAWLEPLLDAIADAAPLLAKGDDAAVHEPGRAADPAAQAARGRVRRRTPPSERLPSPAAPLRRYSAGAGCISPRSSVSSAAAQGLDLGVAGATHQEAGDQEVGEGHRGRDAEPVLADADRPRRA